MFPLDFTLINFSVGFGNIFFAGLLNFDAVAALGFFLETLRFDMTDFVGILLVSPSNIKLKSCFVKSLTKEF